MTEGKGFSWKGRQASVRGGDEAGSSQRPQGRGGDPGREKTRIGELRWQLGRPGLGQAHPVLALFRDQGKPMRVGRPLMEASFSFGECYG